MGSGAGWEGARGWAVGRGGRARWGGQWGGVGGRAGGGPRALARISRQHPPASARPWRAGPPPAPPAGHSQTCSRRTRPNRGVGIGGGRGLLATRDTRARTTRWRQRCRQHGRVAGRREQAAFPKPALRPLAAAPPHCCTPTLASKTGRLSKLLAAMVWLALPRLSSTRMVARLLGLACCVGSEGGMVSSQLADQRHLQRQFPGELAVAPMPPVRATPLHDVSSNPQHKAFQCHEARNLACGLGFMHQSP